ncbi:hypothetical protein ACFOG5_21565 [Pedobacter fastidiosus]|uniref:hypothetical protein n=1 Tax=Pedobacter fastidiosus TaxID=2765361 RepID=UPI00360A8CD8
MCKANIIATEFKSKTILFEPFFQENVRNCIMAHSAPLYTLLRYTPCSLRSGLDNKVLCFWQQPNKTPKFTLKDERPKTRVERPKLKTKY